MQKSEFRFYNVSSQINKDKNHYYDILERMQHADGDITEGVVWYMQQLVEALDEAETSVTTILNREVPRGTVGGRIAPTRNPRSSRRAATLIAAFGSLSSTGTIGPVAAAIVSTPD